MPNQEPSANDTTTTKTKPKTSEQSALFPSIDITDADGNLEQSDLNALTTGTLAEVVTGVTDPATLAFFSRMAIGGEENDVQDQCLRYSLWPLAKDKQQEEESVAEDEDEDEEDVGPFWLTSDHRPSSPHTQSTTSPTPSLFLSP